MYYLGIDPGKTGAVAILGPDGNPVSLFNCPTIGNSKSFQADIVGMADKLRAEILNTGMHPSTFKAAVEDLHIFPGMNAAAQTKLMKNAGHWEMLVVAFQIPLTLIRPQAWQKALLRVEDAHVITTRKNRKTGEQEPHKKVDTKPAAIIAARRMFPTADLTTGNKQLISGRADALLIAHHLMRSG